MKYDLHYLQKEHRALIRSLSYTTQILLLEKSMNIEAHAHHHVRHQYLRTGNKRIVLPSLAPCGQDSILCYIISILYHFHFLEAFLLVILRI